jgi:REP element-mobilizing transposase RayT
MQLNKPRNSRLLLEEVSFWTDTVKDWKKLLVQDKYKRLVLEEWRKLADKDLVTIYGFVIMPNHLHIVWELKKKNGKEMPHASFNKAVGHELVKDLKVSHPQLLPYFKVEEKEREYRIWQANPLAILMDTKAKCSQKLDYMHTNPLQEQWNLAERPEDYYWSSAQFYLTGHDEFGFLTHFAERFG